MAERPSTVSSTTSPVSTSSCCGRPHRDQGRVVPGQLGDRVGQLLQPGVVREAAVDELVVVDEVQLEARLRSAEAAQGALERVDLHHRDHRAQRPIGDHALGEPALPLGVEVGPGLAPVELAEAVVGLPLLALQEAAQQLRLGDAAEQRLDERLDDRHRAVAAPGVPPGLEGMGGGDEPVDHRRGLVVVGAEIDDVGYLLQQRPQLDVGGRGVDRVPGGHHQGVDPPGAQVLDQRLPPGPPGGDVQHRRRGVAHGGAEVAQGDVDRVDHRVDGRALALPGQHQRGAPLPREVLGHRGDELASLRRLGGRGGVAGEAGHRLPQLGGQGEGEALHVRAAELQPVVGHAPGDGEAGLHHVEAVHPRAVLGLPPVGEGEVLVEGGGASFEEVRVEREDDVGLLHGVLRLQRLAEGEPGPLVDRIAGSGAPAVEAGLGEALLDRGPEGAEERRGGGLAEEAQLGSPVLRPGRAALPHRLAEAAPGAPGAALLEDPGPVGVVEAGQLGLLLRAGAAAVQRMGGVALHLHRAAFPGGHQHADRQAVAGDGGGVVERVARRHAVGRLGVGEDPLHRLLGAGGEAGQGHRGAHQLQEVAAGETLGGVEGAEGELPIAIGQGVLAQALLFHASPVGAAVAVLAARGAARREVGFVGELDQPRLGGLRRGRSGLAFQHGQGEPGRCHR